MKKYILIRVRLLLSVEKRQDENCRQISRNQNTETRTQKPEHSMTGQNSRNQNRTAPCRPARVMKLGHGGKDQHSGKRTGTAEPPPVTEQNGT